jgi:hypothetical protein
VIGTSIEQGVQTRNTRALVLPAPVVFCNSRRHYRREREYQILLAHDLKLIPSGRYDELSQEITEIKRMLTVLVQKLTADRGGARSRWVVGDLRTPGIGGNAKRRNRLSLHRLR